MTSFFTTSTTLLLLICSTDSSSAVPFATPRRCASFVPRGGGSRDISAEDNKAVDSGIVSAWDGHPLIGVIDLRPEPEPDSVLFLRDDPTTKGDRNDDAEFDDARVHRVSFPSAAADREDTLSASVAAAEADQQAASSHSIGNVCATVYLIIPYDFENGKTALHSTLGGAKLMAFVDGARSRRHRQMKRDSATNRMGDPSAPATIILLLVPSQSSSATTLLSNVSSASVIEDIILRSDKGKSPVTKILHDLPNKDIDWDASGANFLVSRLSEAFALGGDEYQSLEPFAVEMIGVFNNVGQKIEKIQHRKTKINGNSDKMMKEVILRLVACSLLNNYPLPGLGAEKSCFGVDEPMPPMPEEFHEYIRKTYASAGGVWKC